MDFETYVANNTDLDECPHCGDTLILDEDGYCSACDNDPEYLTDQYPDEDELHERYLEDKYDF